MKVYPILQANKPDNKNVGPQNKITVQTAAYNRQTPQHDSVSFGSIKLSPDVIGAIGTIDNFLTKGVRGIEDLEKMIAEWVNNSAESLNRLILRRDGYGDTVFSKILNYENPKAARTFLTEIVSKLEPDEQTDFVLIGNRAGRTHLMETLRLNQPETAEGIMDIIKRLPKKAQGEVVLSSDKFKNSHLMYAILRKQPETAKDILDIVKTMPDNVRAKAVLSVNENGVSPLMEALRGKQLETAEGIIGIIKNLPKKAQEEFVLSVNNDSTSHLVEALRGNEPKIATDIINIVKNLSEEVQEQFVLTADNFGQSHLLNALIHNQPEIAKDIMNIVRNLSEDAQKRFAHRENFVQVFNAAIEAIEQKTAVAGIVDFILKLKPEVISEVKIPEGKLPKELLNLITAKIANCPDLPKEQKLNFLNTRIQQSLTT